MRKEDIDVLASLFTGMKDALREMEAALKRGDIAKANAAKMKILDFKIKVDRLI
jgi:hypothetical protein